MALLSSIIDWITNDLPYISLKSERETKFIHELFTRQNSLPLKTFLILPINLKLYWKQFRALCPVGLNRIIFVETKINFLVKKSWLLLSVNSFIVRCPSYVYGSFA